MTELMAQPFMQGELLNILLSLYIAGGSMSIGYLFLRMGWPSIRKLEKPYKIGWSAVLGFIFAIVCIAAAFLHSFFTEAAFFRMTLFSMVAVAFLLVGAIVTVRRKFFAKNKVKVQVPKNVVAADKAAGIASDKFELDKSKIEVADWGEDKEKELKQVLGKKKDDEKIADEIIRKEKQAAEKKPKKKGKLWAGKFAQKETEEDAEVKEEEVDDEKKVPAETEIDEIPEETVETPEEEVETPEEENEIVEEEVPEINTEIDEKEDKEVEEKSIEDIEEREEFAGSDVEKERKKIIDQLKESAAEEEVVNEEPEIVESGEGEDLDIEKSEEETGEEIEKEAPAEAADEEIEKDEFGQPAEKKKKKKSNDEESEEDISELKRIMDKFEEDSKDGSSAQA